MNFDEMNKADLILFQKELGDLVRERGLPLGEIAVVQEFEPESLQATAIVLSDPFMDSSGNAEHRRISLCVSMFTVCEGNGRDVLWGCIYYSVEREHSNFFPVPEEYGKEVTIEFGWEFDRETLEYGSAQVRDLNRLHYVSVLPNQQLIDFVECCSEVAERWAGEER